MPYPYYQPSVTDEQIVALLQQYFTFPITQLAPLEGGNVSQTLSFTADGQDYVIRFSQHMGANFEKEAWLYPRLAAAHIPIPPIISTGRLGELHYAISQHAVGQHVHSLPLQAYRQLFPTLLETLYTIHQVDVSDQSRYGTIGDNGMGLAPSWRSHIASVYDEEEDWNFYGKWHKLFETTFLERDLYEQVYTQMMRLLDLCPEERFLVHGNYGFSNVLFHDGRVTAVLDWLDASYGDFVFDFAGLTLWTQEVPLAERCQQFYAAKGMQIAHYTERLRCYQYRIGLDALRFYALTQKPGSYLWMRKHLLSLLQA